VIVCAGILVMRKNDPNAVRPFRAPLVPLTPILGILICSFMIISLDHVTQLSALAWMVVGLLIYFGYSRGRSKLGLVAKK
jgi:APA family basic amino acid/polyamine antiporter